MPTLTVAPSTRQPAPAPRPASTDRAGTVPARNTPRTEPVEPAESEEVSTFLIPIHHLPVWTLG